MKADWGQLVYSAWRRLKPDVIVVFNIFMRKGGGNRYWYLHSCDQWHKEMTWSWVRGGPGWISRKSFSPTGGLSAGTDAPGKSSQHQGWVQASFDQCSQAYGGILVDGPVQELDSMILQGPFQLSTLNDSVSPDRNKVGRERVANNFISILHFSPFMQHQQHWQLNHGEKSPKLK